MTRYILNYVGGSKGDFLCNFLNTSEVVLDKIIQVNKSVSSASYFKSLKIEDFDFKKALDALKEEKMIYPGHSCYKIPEKFLSDNNLKIIDFIYEERYHKTIQIEVLFKSWAQPLDKVSKIKFLKRFDSTISKELLRSFVYQLDISLLQNNIEINDLNRCLLLNNKLHNLDFYYRPAKEEILFNYGEIFFFKNFDSIRSIFKIDEKDLVKKIDQTWLPEKINLFGRDWFPKEYGYLDV